MREHLRFAVVYWHTFRGTGSDPFGSGTMLRPWDDGTNSVANAQNLARARRFVSNLEANGGTEMLPALQAALVDNDRKNTEEVRQVVFITDGAIGNEDQLFAAIPDISAARASSLSASVLRPTPISWRTPLVRAVARSRSWTMSPRSPNNPRNSSPRSKTR